MKNNPLVTIVIATYNSANYIKSALDSVEKQNFDNWECLVIDGKSSDSTIEIVKQYCLKDSRIRYISESDKGIYDAFNVELLSSVPFTISASFDVLIILLTDVELSIIVCTFEVLSVVDITYPTSPLSAITVMLGFIPFLLPTFITNTFE